MGDGCTARQLRPQPRKVRSTGRRATWCQVRYAPAMASSVSRPALAPKHDWSSRGRWGVRLRSTGERLPWCRTRLAPAAIAPAPVGAGTVMRRRWRVRGIQDVHCGGTEVCRAPTLTFPPCRASPKIWVSMVVDEVIRSRPSTSFLNAGDSLLHAATAGFAEGRWFPLRVPVKGNSNTG
jgi:hypothetical protein